MHDRYDSISLLRYVPPETTDDPVSFSLLPLLAYPTWEEEEDGWGRRSGREVVVVSRLVVSSAVVALENYVKASHTLMFGTFALPLETASTSHRHHVLQSQHEAYMSVLTGT